MYIYTYVYKLYNIFNICIYANIFDIHFVPHFQELNEGKICRNPYIW